MARTRCLGALLLNLFRIHSINKMMHQTRFVRAFSQTHSIRRDSFHWYPANMMAVRLASSGPVETSDDSFNNVQLRKKLLHESLVELGMDADGMEAAVQSSASPSYDGRYGTSVIKTCRSFYKNENLQGVDLRAAALRTARQIQFLYVKIDFGAYRFLHMHL